MRNEPARPGSPPTVSMVATMACAHGSKSISAPYVLAVPSFEPSSHRAASPTIGAGAPSHPPAPPEEPSTDEDTLVFSTPVTVEEVTDSLGGMGFHFLGSASQ